MLAVGLLSTAILGALAAESSMTRVSREAATRERAFLLADTRAEAERGGARHSLDWARLAHVLPNGEIETDLVSADLQNVVVTWDERAIPHRRRVTLGFGRRAAS